MSSVTFTKIPSYKGEGNDSRHCSLLSAMVHAINSDIAEGQQKKQAPVTKPTKCTASTDIRSTFSLYKDASFLNIYTHSVRH